MSGGSAPTPPDPVRTANAQTRSNIQTARANQAMNMVDQRGPGYRTDYNKTGSQTIKGPNGTSYKVPTYAAKTQLTGKNKRIYDNSMTATNRAARAAGGYAQDVLNQGDLNFNGISQGGNAGAIGMGRQGMVGAGPQLNGSVAQGNIRGGFNQGGNVTGQIADAGSIQNGFNQGGKVTGNIADAGDITSSYSGDFARQRNQVQDALMARMNPSLQQDKGALESRLASQGIGIGSEAYQSAMGDFGQQTNDARLAAILGAGQEQSRLVGMERDRAGFENQAQGQQFGQNAARSGFANDAAAQRFAQSQETAAFANNAQGQRFGQNETQAGFANDAVAQRYSQNQGAAQFANNAQGQQFGQDLQQVGMQNAARQDMYDNQFARVGANNQASTQQQANNLRQAGYADSTRARDINERMTLRNDPMQRLQALAGLGQPQQAPGAAIPQAGVANTDIAGLINGNYQSQVANYNTQQQGQQELVGGILSAGAYALSDERTKENVKKVGKTNDGQQIYTYRYKTGGPIQMGLMAQEVEKKHPDAVKTIGGVKLVNYGKAAR